MTTKTRTSSKADVWALGCVALQLYAAKPDGKPWSEEGTCSREMIYNKVVFRRMSPLDVAKYQPPEGFLRTLLSECFQFDPERLPGFADIIDAMDKHELAQEKEKAVLAEKSEHAATQETLQEKEQALADMAKELDEERKLRKQKEQELAAKEAELTKQIKAFADAKKAVMDGVSAAFNSD